MPILELMLPGQIESEQDRARERGYARMREQGREQEERYYSGKEPWPSIKEQISLLSADLNHYNDCYYRGLPEVSDAVFDCMMKHLKFLEGDNPAVDSPTQQVGGNHMSLIASIQAQSAIPAATSSADLDGAKRAFKSLTGLGLEPEKVKAAVLAQYPGVDFAKVDPPVQVIAPPPVVEVPSPAAITEAAAIITSAETITGRKPRGPNKPKDPPTEHAPITVRAALEAYMLAKLTTTPESTEEFETVVRAVFDYLHFAE